MYLPDQFQEVDPTEIDGLIAAHPLACIVAQTEAGFTANHLPLLRGKEGEFIGHVALANDMHRLISDGQEVLAIFRGADGYISPNYYPSKSEHHRHVPTWNYQIVHVHGEIAFQRDVRSKRAAVGLLTSHHERRLHGDAAWRMSDAPADYMEAMLDAIVAFRIIVRRIIAKSKLSQNREPRDHRGAVESLRVAGKAALAGKMAQRAPRG